MKPKALIVEDDADVRRIVAEVLDSLGQDHAEADCVETAWTLLTSEPFEYVLLDLQIPVRPNGGFDRIDNGMHLLGRMRDSKPLQHIPVIVVTSHGANGPGLAVKLMKLGAVDFVNKPFDDGQLDSAIQEVLRKRLRGSSNGHEGRPPARPFEGGKLVLFSDRAELSGVEIRRNDGRGYAWQLIGLLARRRDDGSYRGYSSAQVAKELGSQVGQNAVVQCVGDLRERIADCLLREANIACGQRDVIESGGRGYRFKDWITVEHQPSDADSALPESGRRLANDCPGDTANVPGAKRVVPGDTLGSEDNDSWNDRQQWVVEQLHAGAKVGRRDLEAQFGCSTKTAKRDLGELKKAGWIEYLPSPKGYYVPKNRPPRGH